MIKIGFVSTTDSDDAIFIEALTQITDNIFNKNNNDNNDNNDNKNLGDYLEFKVLPYKCEEETYEEFKNFSKRANIVFTKLMGGKDSFPQFEDFRDCLKKYNVPFLPLPTIGEHHPELDEAITVSNDVKLEVSKYLGLDGVENYKNLILYLAQKFADTDNKNIENPILKLSFEKPKSVPWQGIFWDNTYFEETEDYFKYLMEKYDYSEEDIQNKSKIGVIFYRNFYISNNRQHIEFLCNKLFEKGAIPVPVFYASLKNEMGCIGIEKTFEKYFYKNKTEKFGDSIIDALLNTSMFTLSMGTRTDLIEGEAEFLTNLNVPIIQANVLLNGYKEWKDSIAGLSPIDLVIGVAMPEFDGCIIHFPVSSSEKMGYNTLNTEIKKYIPIKDRVNKIVDMTLKYSVLNKKPNCDKKIAIIFHNYPPRNDKIASAHGLDSPESVLNILKTMEKAGYRVNTNYENGTELIKQMLECATNDLRYMTEDKIKKAVGKISREDYKEWYDNLSDKVKNELIRDWGDIPGEVMNFDGKLIVPGILEGDGGNIFISVQPQRGYSDNKDALYHSVDIVPPHHYLAYYKWVKNVFKADAVMHIGKHGTLEWLPGKGLGLSEDCYPDVCSELPNIYPYIVNNPGEGTQAKRRGYATIITHLIPPMTISEIYDDLMTLERSIDEYYELDGTENKSSMSAEDSNLDLDMSTKKGFLKQEIIEKIRELKLDEDLMDSKSLDDIQTTGRKNNDRTTNKEEETGSNDESYINYLNSLSKEEFDDFLTKIHNYLEDLKTRQINDGLHIMGLPLYDTKLNNMLFMITRWQYQYLEILSSSLGYNWDELNEDKGKNHFIIDKIYEIGSNLLFEYEKLNFDKNRINELYEFCKNPEINEDKNINNTEDVDNILYKISFTKELKEVLAIVSDIHTNLMKVGDELTNTVRGIAGEYIPPRIAGAPTRDTRCIPTGRNFYSCNPEEIPTTSANDLGIKLANQLIDKYVAEEGEYPEYLGVVLWSSPTMRTKGDDVAEILHLLGVRPVWKNKKVIGTEVISLEELKRPRIDTTLRISGLLRDTFPQIIYLIDDAIRVVAKLDEPDEMNFIKKHYKEEMAEKINGGMSEVEAEKTSLYRIFGDRAGTYGAGIAELITEQNWETVEDMGKVYVEWGCNVYGRDCYGIVAKDEFIRQLSRIQATVKNEDNQEGDILEGDDFNSYHGGLIAAITHYSGKQPRSYVGDSSNPNKLETKHLKEECKQIFRTKIMNPKWIKGMKRHGYKGAGDMSKMIDNTFAWDATSNIADDWMYETIAKTYVFDEEMQEFFEENNPYAELNIIERLFEANARNMWNASDETLEKLRQRYLEIDGDLEESM
ncbi:cobaltochelatase subunit CobN [Methanococcus voltae]|uniref:Cobaltochelatase n=1 Tax=Methanococcus voltae (strain ATCC BAA-1334 / A3) TaxID=456320 RepID=D7DT78_METV3|nr:cobaltochelatase subunit CobN [Methanococcus voltae]MCS3901188.1 cobaltochelatase CobN [Methanococcus voltae]